MDDPAPQKLRATFNMPAFTGMLRVAHISLGSELRDGLMLRPVRPSEPDRLVLLAVPVFDGAA
jgi:hypothetical protein